MTVEELKVLITAETAGLQKQIKNVQNQLKGLDTASTKVASKMTGAFKKLAKAFSITAIVAGLYKIGKSAVSAASDLEEIQNVVDVAFGDAAAEIDAFAKTCITRFGLSEAAAKNMASTFMSIGSSMGIANSSAKTMSVQLTGLAADMASFYNTSVEAVSSALEGIYTGQTRALRQYGIVLTDATLAEYALSQGITKSVASMSAAEKATLRYNYVLQQTANAQNDFARTSGSWANQIRLLRQQWNAFMTELGSIVTAILIPIVKWLNTVLAYLTAVVKAFKAVFNIGQATDKTTQSTKKLSDAAGGIGAGFDSANTAAKKLKNTISGFDELEVLNSQDDAGAGSGIPDIGGGGYDVGTYFDPEDFTLPDTTEFQKNVEGIIAVLKDFVDYILGPVTKAVKWLVDFIYPAIYDPETGEKTGNKIDWAHLLGLAGLIAAVAAIKGILKGYWGAIEEGFSGTGTWWDKVLVFIKGGPKAVADGFKAMFAAFGKKIAELFSFLGSAFAPFGKLLFTWLIKPVQLLGSILGKALSAVFAPLVNVLKSLWGILEPILAKLFAPLLKLLQPLINLFGKLWGVIAANPFPALAIAIGLAIASVIHLWNTNEDFREALDELWRNVLQPVVDYVIEMAQYVWNSILKPLWDNIKGMVGDLVKLVTTIWDMVSSFIGWISIYILPPIWMVAGEIIACVTRIFGNIGEIINGIITTIRGIIQFLTGVFTGDWGKAWEGIKNVFKGVWDSLVGIAKGPLNLVIGLINTALGAIEGALNSVARALNRISIKIPDWVPGFGGKTYGFNISTVQLVRLNYLANGGVLTEPTAAMMGEYPGAHNNPEIVTPENLMRQIVMEGNDDLADTFIAVGRQIVAAIQDNNVEIKIGDDVISAAAARGARDFKKRTGRSQFAI